MPDFEDPRAKQGYDKLCEWLNKDEQKGMRLTLSPFKNNVWKVKVQRKNKDDEYKTAVKMKGKDIVVFWNILQAVDKWSPEKDAKATSTNKLEGAQDEEGEWRGGKDSEVLNVTMPLTRY